MTKVSGREHIIAPKKIVLINLYVMEVSYSSIITSNNYIRLKLEKFNFIKIEKF